MVKGAATVLLNSSTNDVIDAIGCTETEWQLVTGQRIWIGVDRARVSRILDSLLFGLIDTIGLPRFELPAEYMAAMVSIFVSPCNYFSACTWLGSFVPGDDLAGYSGRKEPVEGFERVKPAQIFALVLDIRSSGVINPIASKFAQKVDLKLAILQEAI